MPVVVDASVAIKWVVDEDGSHEARALPVNDLLVAPDFLLLETANVLWALVRRQKISKDEALVAFATIEAAPIRFIPLTRFAAAAHAIAFELNQTVYDSLYLAAALAERSIFVTADQAFFRTATAHPVYNASIKLLGA